MRMIVTGFTLLFADLSLIVSCSCDSRIDAYARKAVDIYLSEMQAAEMTVGRQMGKHAPWRTNKIAHVE